MYRIYRVQLYKVILLTDKRYKGNAGRVVFFFFTEGGLLRDFNQVPSD